MRLNDRNDYFTCEFCGRLHFPEPNVDGVRVLGELVEARCSLCSDELVHAAVAGVRVLHCPSCRGLLIPIDGFLLVLQHLRYTNSGAAAPPRTLCRRELERQVACPRCHRPMHTHPYAGPGNIVIDNCTPCGVNWLDQGELRRVVSTPESQYTAHE